MKKILKTFLKLRTHKIKLKGESIVEVVTATVILATILVSTFAILSRATQTNANIRNRVISLNIAREGIEAVRNIRDTNWLKYSGDRRKAWLCLDSDGSYNDENACQSGTTGHTIPNGGSNGGYYTIDFHKNDERYYLTRLGALGSGSDKYTDAIDESNARLYKVPTQPKRYTHETTGNNSTIFYRLVYLEVLDPYNSAVGGRCNGTANCEDARLNVVSKVQWKEDGALRTTTLETHLFDFFERNEY